MANQQPSDDQLTATVKVASSKLRTILRAGYTGEIKLHCKNGIIHLVERNVKEPIAA